MQANWIVAEVRIDGGNCSNYDGQSRRSLPAIEGFNAARTSLVPLKSLRSRLG